MAQNSIPDSHTTQQAPDHVAPNDGQYLRLKAALSFVNQVKTRTSQHATLFPSFIHLMEESKRGTIDPNAAIQKIETLFADFPELHNGFWRFMSAPNHQLPGSDEMAKHQTNERAKAENFLRKVKQKCMNADMPETYTQFLDAFGSWRAQEIGIIQLRDRLFSLLEGFPDLVMELNGWFGSGYRIDPLVVGGESR